MNLFDKKIDSIKVEGIDYVALPDLENVFGISEIDVDNYGYTKPKLNVNEYVANGDYLNFSKLSVESWDIVNLDDFGIPENKFRWGTYYYPITIAHYGLQLYGNLINSTEVTAKQYMGDETHVETSFKRGLFEFKLASSLSVGFLLENIDSVKIENLKISEGNSFRVYFTVIGDSALQAYCIYEGDSKVIADVNYLSILDFKVFAKKRISISNIKIRGEVGLSLLIEEDVSKRKILLDKADNIAEWFLDNQDDSGSWVSNFDHMFYLGRTDVMKSGWTSGLGQGLAISFLIRMYVKTKKNEYLKSCESALKVFSIPVENGGILRLWAGEYSYYEEYPTEPASYVLNGFMYSLIGLYDLSVLADNAEARDLYTKGLQSLKLMLPLYDLGDRSAYDLTHYTCGAFPNIARWGYHDTHLNLLMAIYTMTQDKSFLDVYDRWKSYAVSGFRCKHN